jgi:hypothetical protein
MHANYVKKTVARLLNRDLSDAEVEKLIKEVGSREEFAAGVLLRNQDVLEGGALLEAVKAQSVKPFDHVAKPLTKGRSEREITALVQLEEQIRKLIQDDQAEYTQAKTTIEALNTYSRSYPKGGKPSIVDMAVRR